MKRLIVWQSDDRRPRRLPADVEHVLRAVQGEEAVAADGAAPPLLHGGVDISAYVVGTAEHRDGVARRREQLAAVRGELRVAGLLAARLYLSAHRQLAPRSPAWPP